MTPILILAAGQSTRMRGADKLMEPIDGIPQIRRIATAAVANSTCVFVAVPSPDHPRAVALIGLPVTLVPTPNAAEGQAVTLRQGIAVLPDCARFMVVLADLPEIDGSDLAAVLAAPERDPDALIWRGATQSGQPGHPILFAASLRPLFAELTGDTGGEKIVRAHLTQTVLVPLPGHRARLDLDTPEDWAAWRAAR